jgi:hypothetical protein
VTSESEPTPISATWAKRNKWLNGLSLAPFGLAALLLLVTIATGIPVVGLAPHLIGLGAVARLFLRRRNPWPEPDRTSVSVKDGVLSFSDQRIPLSDIKNAVIIPGEPNPQILIERKRLGLPVRLFVNDAEEARAVLRMIGWDATQRTLSDSAMSWVMSSSLRLFGTIFGSLFATFVVAGLAGAVFPPLIALAPLFILTMAFFALAPSRITIGGDGILLEWLKWKKFIALTDLLSARVFDEGMGRNRRVGILLLTKSQGEVRVAVGGGWNVEKAQALVERIAEVRAAGKAAAIGEAAANGFIAQIGEAAKSTKEWLAELRALGSGAMVTHRVAPIAPETLLRVVEDATAPPPARVAAAVALKASGDVSAQARVRVAAETAAHPKLRVALERTIEDDEVALVEAVDALKMEGN